MIRDTAKSVRCAILFLLDLWIVQSAVSRTSSRVHTKCCGSRTHNTVRWWPCVLKLCDVCARARTPLPSQRCLFVWPTGPIMVTKLVVHFTQFSMHVFRIFPTEAALTHTNTRRTEGREIESVYTGSQWHTSTNGTINRQRKDRERGIVTKLTMNRGFGMNKKNWFSWIFSAHSVIFKFCTLNTHRI